MESMPETFEYIPSFTTRPRRTPEDTFSDEDWTYVFMDDEAFNATPMLQQTIYNGYQYGTAKLDFDNALADNKIPMLAVTEDGVQHFIDAGYFPLVLRIDPYNFQPRSGREAADANRPSLPAGGGYSYSPIAFDWNLSPHKRKMSMLTYLYATLGRML
jgi:hypothetical protein